MRKACTAKKPPRLANAILRLRQRTRLTQQQFADLAGLSKTYLGHLERGYDPRTKKLIRPGVDTLRAIADAAARDLDGAAANSEQADRYYRDLAEAAGYLPASLVEAAETPPARRVMPRQRIAALWAQFPEWGTALDAIPDGLNEDDVEFVRQHLEMTAALVRKRKGLPLEP